MFGGTAQAQGLICLAAQAQGLICLAAQHRHKD